MNFNLWRIQHHKKSFEKKISFSPCEHSLLLLLIPSYHDACISLDGENCVIEIYFYFHLGCLFHFLSSLFATDLPIFLFYGDQKYFRLWNFPFSCLNFPRSLYFIPVQGGIIERKKKRLECTHLTESLCRIIAVIVRA